MRSDGVNVVVELVKGNVYCVVLVRTRIQDECRRRMAYVLIDQRNVGHFIT